MIAGAACCGRAASLRSSRNSRSLHASGRYTDKQCYDIQGEINYFTENKERMDYPLYRSVSLPIGSGVMVMRTEGGLRWNIAA